MQEDVGSSTEDVEFNNFIAERRRILADAVSLKTWAVAYGRPADAPVLASATSSGRNYFDRPSASFRETRKDAAYVAKILADAAALKKLAADYARPGPVEVSPDVFGRNYFDRASAPEVVSKDEADKRARVLAEAAAFKDRATDYSDVNKPVAVDPVIGRCFFDRPSADDTETYEEAEERAKILADCKAFKKSADSHHRRCLQRQKKREKQRRDRYLKRQAKKTGLERPVVAKRFHRSALHYSLVRRCNERKGNRPPRVDGECR